MVNIVNRETEKTLIDDAFKALHNYKEVLLRTPLIDFYGVEGIGKTVILKHIEQKCKDQHIRYILVENMQNVHQFSREIIKQVEQYNIFLPKNEGDLFQMSRQATKKLLAKGIAVMLLDAVDASNKELVE